MSGAAGGGGGSLPATGVDDEGWRAAQDPAARQAAAPNSNATLAFHDSATTPEIGPPIAVEPMITTDSRTDCASTEPSTFAAPYEEK